MVSVRLYPNQVIRYTLVACHERLTERGHVRYDWQHYITLIERKP